MKTPPRELEIKLEFSADQMRRLKTVEIEGCNHIATATTKLLTSTYFDTKNWSLREKGLSLRIRQIDGRWVQTVKADRTVSGGVSSTIEIEAEVAGAKPELDAIDDKDLRRQIERMTARSRLLALFDTEIRRTSRRIETIKGDKIEISFDEGRVVTRPAGRRTKARTAPIREVEIELLAGDPAALLDTAVRLAGDSPMRLGRCSKSDLGYELLGAGRTPVQVLKSKPPTIDGSMTARAAVQLFVDAAVTQILASWRVILDSDDVEGVHQLRVGVRRLRTVLRIVRYNLEDEALSRLDGELRELARAAGGVRDLDVLASDILGPLDGSEQFAAGLASIRKSLAAEKALAREALVGMLEQKSTVMLRLRLGLLPHSIAHLSASALDEPTGDLAARALKKLGERAKKRGKDFENATVGQRHELRKALKSLRYGSEFLGPAYSGADLGRIAKASARLQDLLGYHNDVALAARLKDLVSLKSGGTSEVDLAVGAVIGWHTARDAEAMDHVADAWKRLRKQIKAIIP